MDLNFRGEKTNLEANTGSEKDHLITWTVVCINVDIQIHVRQSAAMLI
jgi:hypothetical protein